MRRSRRIKNVRASTRSYMSETYLDACDLAKQYRELAESSVLAPRPARLILVFSTLPSRVMANQSITFVGSQPTLHRPLAFLTLPAYIRC